MLASKKRDLEHWGGLIPPRGAPPQEMDMLCSTPLALKDGRPVALIFTAMADYVHQSTASAAHACAELAARRGYRPLVSSNPAHMEGEPRFAVVVMVNNSGRCFDLCTEALSKHVAQGRGVLGVHACIASFLDGEDAVGSTELGKETNLITDVFGCHFVNHPVPQEAVVHVDQTALQTAFGGALSDAPATSLPATFTHHDEFFNFDAQPADVTVLCRVEEASYQGGTMGDDHPIVWCAERGANKARVFFCGLGHFDSFYEAGVGGSHVLTLLETGFNFVAPAPTAN
jgi:type 1 glutamine amidotransferase